MEHVLSRLSPYTLQLLIVSTLWYALTQFCLDRLRRRTGAKLREEQARRQRAEAANRAKAVFLTSMSHEIRAPLNAIIGFTELALNTDLNPELREYLDTVRASADWLSHVVNEIVDFARMEACAIQLASEPFSIRDILRSAINIADPLAQKRKLMLRLHLDGALPPRVQGDRTRFLQVVYNLIENATKFTTSGSILVTASLESTQAESVTVRIAVADTGVGIPPERVEHLFEPLAQVSASLDRKSRTCGFGLPICQRLVNMMGGTIEVQSRPGIGSTFAFSLNFQLAAPHEAAVKARKAQLAECRRLRILVADDSAASRRLATVLLQGAGHQVTEAVNGLEALKIFTAGYFDLVLMDIEMPELSGIAATKAIRATEPEGRCTPIYALTAHAGKTDEQACLKAGMTGYLTKPLNVEALLQIAAGIGAAKPDPPASAQSDDGTSARTSLLSLVPQIPA